MQRYVRRRREEMARERDRRDAEGFLAPGWLPGEARAGFGEADLGVRGVLTRGKCPAAAFPHPDAGPAQVFWGETSECVCQGLRNVSGFAGGVPRGRSPATPPVFANVGVDGTLSRFSTLRSWAC